MEIEEEKRLAALAAKEDCTDAELGELVAWTVSWLKPVFAKLPEYSKKTHAAQMKGLLMAVKRLGAAVEELQPEPSDEEAGGDE